MAGFGVLLAMGVVFFMLLREQRKRQDDLRSLAAALELLRGEISSGIVPLALGIERANTHASGIGNVLFSKVLDGFPELGDSSFEEIWDKALTASCPWLPAILRWSPRPNEVNA